MITNNMRLGRTHTHRATQFHSNAPFSHKGPGWIAARSTDFQFYTTPRFTLQ